LQTIAVIIVLGYLLQYFFDDVYKQGGRVSPFFIKSFICQKATDWFPFRCIVTTELSLSHRYIFAIHPHGLMPWPLLPFGKTLFPEIPIRCVAADVVFSVPIAREAVIAVGGISASRSSCINALLQGNSLAILIGGAAEMLECEPDREDEVLCLNSRKGFVRLALEYGCHLVPCYCFGVTELYQQMTSAKSLRLWFLKYSRIGCTFGVGRSCYNLLPKQRPLYLVIGAPITVEKKPNYSEEDVEKLHSRYLVEIENIYNQWKDKLHYNKELKII